MAESQVTSEQQASQATVEQQVVGAGGEPPVVTEAAVLVVEPTGGGDRAMYARVLCDQFHDAGRAVALLTARRSSVPAGASADDGCAVETNRGLRAPGDRGMAVAALVALGNALVVLRALRRYRTNVVLWHGGMPGRWDALFVRLLHFLHRRVVWLAYEVPAGPSRPRRHIRRLYARVDSVVTFSDAHRERLAEAVPLSAERFTTVRAGDMRSTVETMPDPADARARFGLSAGVVVALVHAVPEDGGSCDLIRAVAEARQRGAELQVLVVEEAKGAAEVTLDVARQVGVDDAIAVLPGPVSAADVDEAYAACDFAVATAAPDRFSLTPLRAFAHGRPCVVPNDGGLDEYVKEGLTGEVYEAGDAGDLAETIIELVGGDSHLRRRQRRLVRNQPRGLDWKSVLRGWQVVLALDRTATGRRFSVPESRRAIRVLYGLALFISIAAVITNGLRGTDPIKNLPFIGAVLLPIALVFFVAVPFEWKMVGYVFALLYADLFRRLLFPMPMQYIAPLILAAAFVHLLAQPPKDRLTLWHTRFVHAVIVLMAGWVIAQLFNPNMLAKDESIRTARVILEPLIAYVCLLAVLRSSNKARWFATWVFGGIAVAQLWGLKIAFFGYFGFEDQYLALTGSRVVVAESRNIGTMATPQEWSMYSVALLAFCLALLLERGAIRHRWALVPLLPIAAMNVISSGNRMAVVALVVACSVVLFMAVGSRVTRTRAVAALALAAAAGTVIWFWIPDEGNPRIGLSEKNPLDAARQKLSSLKNPENDPHTVENRVKDSGATIEAIIEDPVGGGVGVLAIAGLDSSTGSGFGGVNTSLETARGRNRIFVQPGDYLYINWMAELGIPGLILLVVLFVTVSGWCLYAYMNIRKPFGRALTLVGLGWCLALLVNSVTNGAFYLMSVAFLFYLFLAFSVSLPAAEQRELGPVRRYARDDEAWYLPGRSDWR